MYNWFSHRFYISNFLVFSVVILFKKSKNYIKFDRQYRSTPTLEATQFQLHKSSEHQIAKQYQESDNCGEIDLKSNVNRLATGKLPQSTTVYSQYE